MAEKCIDPKRLPIKDKDYFTPHGERIDYMTVGCGKCTFCQGSIKLDWIFRLEEEAKDWPDETHHFTTLTYSDFHLLPPVKAKPRIKKGESKVSAQRRQKRWEHHKNRSEQMLYYPDIQNYVKRMRKREQGSFFVVGEYGSKTWRSHWHMISFGFSKENLEKEWNYGRNQVKRLKGVHTGYVLNYLDKDEWQEIKREMPDFTGVQQFRRMSQGIGDGFLERMSAQDKEDYLVNGGLTVTTSRGIKTALPRYYRSELRKNLTEIEDKTLTGLILYQQEEEYAGRAYERYVQHGITHQRFLEINRQKDADKRQKAKRKRRDLKAE